ncbi:zinc ABC transporter substrate-binding protein ZnuA [Vibrio nigripulchritudo]|uniref:zinc ABC transporter substrate-binding protein ZnuA n=1 Tax=Vibrio nigripulchritudo TaxID=28173 RepID=UPI0005FA5ED0|nr:zinc ABC transporter substrate-binding protein ZnuA [Vibrio nigripulchritudo]KJY69073.1 zinc ABC transporter substrate-binding protein [Vibrio nigripulchritudo]
MSRFGRLFLLLSLFPAFANAANVLSSIKPIQLITNEITEGVSTSEVLLSTNTSPHDYALKPSDVKKIRKADLVVWVGPELETFLTGVMESHSGAFALHDQPEMILREYGGCGCDKDKHDDHHEGHDHDKHDHDKHDHDKHDHHDHDDHHGHGSHDGHNHGTHDMHIWLGPEQALQAATAIANKLSAIDAKNAQRYQDNLKKFESNLSATIAELEKKLSPVRQNGYFVFHDAYGYYENYFKLNNLGHFTVSPERKPGAKTLNKIRKKLESKDAHCVFSEPQFTPAVINSVTRGTDVNKGELDPLAVSVKVQPGAYFDFLKSLGTQFSSCLSE